MNLFSWEIGRGWFLESDVNLDLSGGFALLIRLFFRDVPGGRKKEYLRVFADVLGFVKAVSNSR